MSTTAPRPWRVSPHTIQAALGALWLFDGVLQLQPKMFGPAFVSQVVAPSAEGQPRVVAWPITVVAHLLSAHPAAWNWVFASLQLLIGAGLLHRDTVRPALVLSFVWSAGVWVVGEGCGMLLTASASPFTGAPGAVLLYAVIGVLVWPPRPAPETAAPGTPAVRAADLGPLGARGAHVAWCVLWVGMAGLWLLPANRTAGSFSQALTGAAASSPQWLAHLQHDAARTFSGDGLAVAAAVAVASVVIGVGPLLARRGTVFLVAGVALALDFWVLGQSLGGIVTGVATDVNTGPLIVVLALALFPNDAPAPPAVAPAGLAPVVGPHAHLVLPG